MDLLVCIRFSGEASIKRCEEFISDQVSADVEILVVEEMPFWKSMERCFMLAREKGKRWLLCVDADVYLRDGAIDFLIGEAEKLPGRYCELQGQMLDRFFGGIRAGGIHLYRASLSSELLDTLNVTKTSTRPERDLLKEMKKKGYPHRQISYVVGLHDYDQMKIDVIRKGYQHSRKHLSHAKFLIPYWKERQKIDSDFEWILQGFAYGIGDSADLALNASSFRLKTKGSIALEGDKIWDSNIDNFAKIELEIQSCQEPIGFNEFFLGGSSGWIRFLLVVEHYLRLLKRLLFSAVGIKRL